MGCPGSRDISNNNNKKFDFFVVLKKLEPIAILITISLAIAAFTSNNPNLAKVQEYSVISSVMFIIVLFIGIFNQYSFLFEKRRSMFYPLIIFLIEVSKFSFFLFFSFGIIFLLLNVYEFSKNNQTILLILRNFFILFLGFSSLKFFNKIIEKNKENGWIKNWIKNKHMDIIVNIFLILFALIFPILKIFDSVSNNTLSEFYINILLNYIGPIIYVILIIFFIIHLIKTIRLPKSKVRSIGIIIYSCIVIILIIVPFILLLYENSQDIERVLNDMINNIKNTINR